MQNKETIVQKVYDLIKESVPFLNSIPRKYKFTLGDRMQNQLFELLEFVIEAYYLPVTEKKSLLKKANTKIEILRHYFRLCYEFGLYNSLKYKHYAEKLDEIGRMIGGWLRSLK